MSFPELMVVCALSAVDGADATNETNAPGEFDATHSSAPPNATDISDASNTSGKLDAASDFRPELIHVSGFSTVFSGNGVEAGADWRILRWLRIGPNIAFFDQSPLRTSVLLRAHASTSYQWGWGGFVGGRLDLGMRFVRTLGDVFELSEDGVVESSDRGVTQWTQTLSVEAGYDFRALAPIRLSAHAGAQAYAPVQNGIAADPILGLRVAYRL